MVPVLSSVPAPRMATALSPVTWPLLSTLPSAAKTRALLPVIVPLLVTLSVPPNSAPYRPALLIVPALSSEPSPRKSTPR